MDDNYRLKAEVARRQLGTALALYLDDRDPVSVHTLAVAGAELAEGLCATTEGSRTFRSFRLADTLEPMTDAAFTIERSVYANALKHYNTLGGKVRDDTTKLASLTDQDNDVRLFMAWWDFASADLAHPVESHVFQAWFLALDPAKLDNPDAHGLKFDLEREFPGLPGLSRAKQKRRLRHTIDRARRHNRLMSDPKVDPRPLWLHWPP